MTGTQDTAYDNWPHGLAPSQARVYARNEIVIGAQPQYVWRALVHAKAWPRWYDNARGMYILTNESTLAEGTVFSWVTFGTRICSQVDRCSVDRVLGWWWRGTGSQGYHVWQLFDHPTGTHVITEETQIGIGPTVLKPLLNRGLHFSHDLWLRGLEQRAIARSVEDAGRSRRPFLT